MLRPAFVHLSAQPSPTGRSLSLLGETNLAAGYLFLVEHFSGGLIVFRFVCFVAVWQRHKGYADHHKLRRGGDRLLEGDFMLNTLSAIIVREKMLRQVSTFLCASVRGTIDIGRTF